MSYPAVRQCGSCHYGEPLAFTRYLAWVTCVKRGSSHDHKLRRAWWFACSLFEERRYGAR